MFKEFKNMKTLRYLLIAMVIGLASASVQAQVKQSKQNGKTEYQFHSTSTRMNSSSSSALVGSRTTSTLMGDGQISPLMTSGSRLPIAARNGVIVGASSPDDGTPAYTPHRARKDVGDDGFEDEEPEPDPMEEPFPVGDGMWVLIVLATIFCGVIYLRRKRVTDVKELKS